MEKKVDRRVRYTKMVLRESLLDILEKKPIGQISISELCEKADVNRNTFYNHYSAPYEVLHEMEDELFDGLRKEIQDLKDLKGILLASCRAIEQNKKLSRLIYADVENSRILSKIIDSFKNVLSQDYSEIAREPERSYARYVFVFGQHGAIYTMKNWVDNGFKQSADDVALFITSLLENLNNSFQYSKVKK